MKFSVTKYRKVWFAISGSMVLFSILFMVFWGLRFGIDFTGGSLMEVQVGEVANVTEVRKMIEDLGFHTVEVQQAGEQGLLIRTKNLTEEEHQQITVALEQKFETIDELRFDSIGPTIGNELRRTSTIGIIVTLILIGGYVGWAFRRVSEPVASWKYGVLTIVAAFHDVLISVGVFSILGHFFGWEIGTAFVAAALTILGYSINDTVVVFDRTRENLGRRISDDFEEVVDISVRQTFTRSFNTSITTLLALLAIFILGGEATRPFALALIIGISVGTFSSIFLASPLLVTWEGHKQKKV